MKLMALDCGYVVALAVSRRVFRVRLPFPVTLHSWRYLVRRWFA